MLPSGQVAQGVPLVVLVLSHLQSLRAHFWVDELTSEGESTSLSVLRLRSNRVSMLICCFCLVGTIPTTVGGTNLVGQIWRIKHNKHSETPNAS